MPASTTNLPYFNTSLFRQDGLQRQRIKIAYGAALFVTALVGLLICAVLIQAASIQLSTADAIRLNTEQRMHIQRATLVLSQLAEDEQNGQSDALRAELNEHLNLLKQDHEAFLQSYPRNTLPLEVAALYFNPPNNLDNYLSEYLQLAHELGAATDADWSSQNADYQRVLELSPILREQYNTIIILYDGIHQAQAANLRIFAFAILSGLLTVLALEAVFIFRPMELAIRRQQSQLEAEIKRREQVEISLRQSETTYRLLAQHLPDMGVLMFDHDLRYMLAEGPALDATGFSRAHVEGNTLQEVVPALSYEALLPFYKKALTGESSLIERPFAERDYVTQFVPVYDEAHQVIGGMVTSQDITARKQAEAALHTSAARFRSIAENATDMIALLDEQFCYVYANPAHETTLGIDPATLVGQPVFGQIHPDDVDRVRQQGLALTSEREKSGSLEYRRVHADGHYVWVEGRPSFLYEGAGKFQGAVVVLRDLTERRHLQALQLEQERLQTSLTKERELSELKSRMMTRIAHEFRTPLASIWLTFDMINRYYDRLTAEQRLAKRRTIDAQIHRITHMLDDIALVVKGDFAPNRLDMTTINLRGLCQEIIEEIESETQQTHRFALAMPEGMVIHGDWTTLKRALHEVLSNAAQFSSRETEVQVQAEEQNDHLILRIIDHGIGIRIDEQARIFEPFFRGSNINEIGGLGVGLTIAQESIIANQGTVAIESQEKIGRQSLLRSLPNGMRAITGKNHQSAPLSFRKLPRLAKLDKQSYNVGTAK